jgi:hypothetical protein
MVLMERGGKFPESLRLGTGRVEVNQTFNHRVGQTQNTVCPTFRRFNTQSY